jgi:hypothetical protein
MIGSPARPPSPACSFAAGLAVLSLFTGCRTIQPETPANPAAINQPTFALIDANADGKVSPAEMAAYKHEEGLAEVDLDNDKRVSLVEWKAARPSATTDDGTFARLDLNKDGFISEDEAVTHITAQAAYQAAFKKMDANGDGHLHWEEYAAGDAASLNVTLTSGGTAAAPTESVGSGG